MIFLAPIERELQAAARQPATYLLRLVGAGITLFAAIYFLLQARLSAGIGSKLFSELHFTLFWALWILVPLLASDCISRERREGTLGLLFLTRLSGAELALAKGLAHGLRALTVWLAVAPIMALSLLVGGVSWEEISLSVVVNFNVICWALAAALLGSAWSITWRAAVVRSLLLSFGFMIFLSLATGLALPLSLSPGGLFRWETAAEDIVLSGFGALSDAMNLWPKFLRISSASTLIGPLCLLTALSLAVLAGAIALAGRKAARAAKDSGPSRLAARIEGWFCRPILWRRQLKAWMRWHLSRNPVGWLERRSWSGRLVTWAWLAVVVALYSAALADQHSYRSYQIIRRIIGWLMLGSVALSAVGSFRRERATGVLELLLVSPMGEKEIIKGRLFGLWGQFMPAVALLTFIWYWLGTFSSRYEEAPIFYYAVAFMVLPVVGLCFSLLYRNFIFAFLMTLFVTLTVPMIFSNILAYVDWLTTATTPFYIDFDPHVSTMTCQLIIAFLCYLRLRRILERRKFAMDRLEG